MTETIRSSKMRMKPSFIFGRPVDLFIVGCIFCSEVLLLTPSTGLEESSITSETELAQHLGTHVPPLLEDPRCRFV